jgi:hypothetical protein
MFHRRLPHVIAIVALLLASLPLLAQPTAATQTSISGPNALGINVGSSLDYETNRVFADVMKTSRDWKTLSDGTPTTDSNGWPTQDAKIVVWHGINNMHGSYKLSFTGQANVATGFGSASIQNKVYNATTNTTTADLIYNSTDGAGLQLTFTGTSSGVKNVKLMRPITPGSTTSYGSSVTFTDQFKNSLAKFSVLRFMDFTATNSNQQVNWSDRVLPSHASQSQSGPGYGWQGKGAAWEYVIQLTNELDKDMWICIPHKATDDYIRQLATLIKNTLEPDRKVYVEWSNELWNTAGAFQQSFQNRDAALAEVQAGGSILNYDGQTNEWYLAYRRQAKRTVETSLIFRSVFGDAAMMTRIRPVLMSQLGYWDGPPLQALAFLENYYGTVAPTPRRPNYYIWGYSGSAYYSPTHDASSADTVFSTMPPSDWTTQLRRDTDWAAAWGLKHVAYEGGPGLDRTGNSTYDAAREAAWNDARMKQEVIDAHNTWSANGGDLLMYFTVAGDFQWGFTKDVLSLNSPKFQAIDALAPANRAAPTYGTLVPATISASSFNTPPGWYQGSPSSMSGRKWFSYTIRVATAGTYAIGVRAGSANSNGRLEILVDGNSLGTVAIPNTGSTSTFANSTTLNVSLQPGIHGIMIKGAADSYNVNQINVTSSGSATPTNTPLPNPTSTPTPAPLPSSLRVETGGSASYTDGGGRVWAADYGYQGGSTIDRGAIAIDNTTDDRLYQTERYGMTGYKLPLANGSYTVRLHFAETYDGITGSGQRVFSANVEGSSISNIDIFAEAGGRNRALVKSVNVNVADGELTIGFTSSVQSPLINAIEAVAATTPTPTPTSAPPSGTLLAADSFSGAAGTLHNASGGSGWGGTWQIQHGDTSVPGYNLASGSLSYSTLAVSGNNAIGGDSYQTAGRAFNTSSSGPFGSYLSNGLIGANGSTLYLSALLRKDVANDEELSLTLHYDTIVTYPNPALVSVGYFGSASNNGTTRYWSLKVGSTVYRTNVPITAGQTALLVLKLDFAASSTASLYVNPGSLGGSAPSTPNVQGTTTSSLAFRSLAFYGGNGFNQSALDEIRVGSSFAAVTP